MGGTDVSAGGVAVGVIGVLARVGKLQEDNRINTVVKERRRFILQIICEKIEERIAPLLLKVTWYSIANTHFHNYGDVKVQV